MKILITGGSNGIGLQTAKELNRLGHDLTITYFSDEKNAEVLKKEDNINSLKLSITDTSSIESVASFIENENFEILINNACPSFPLMPLRKVKSTEFTSYVSQGIEAVHTLSNAFVKSRKKEPGQIINILSAYTTESVQAQMAPYITLKYALLGLTKCMAKEYQAKKIIVNAVSPAMTDTNLLRNTFPEKFIEMAKESHPNGDILQPEAVANSIIQLINCNGAIVGANLPITGSAL